MGCPDCGVDVVESQKFCHECGARISALDADLPTQPVTTTGISEPDETADPSEPDDDTSVLDDTTELDAATDPAIDPDAVTTTLPAPLITDTPVVVTAGLVTTETATPDDTTPFESPAATPTRTAEMPAMIFDGHSDLEDYPAPREPFRLRVEFILALFGGVALLMTIIADITDIRTTRPAAGIVTGTTTLEDLGSSLGPAAFAGAAAMMIGGLLACFGLRWGAGLAGGGGLALAGWAGLTIGLAELPIAIAESITRTSTEEFTLRVTRDVGWWLIVGVGVIALLVFAVSLRSIGTGGRPALNPIIAAVTAVAMVVVAFGPMIAVGDASFADNFGSPDPQRDLPTLFFAGRLGQLALIALAGAIGLLIVRSYGLGLAAGGLSVGVVLWVFSIAEIGDRPVGIAERNPGAANTVPHAVTTTGMVSSLVLLVFAAAFAIVRLRERPAR